MIFSSERKRFFSGGIVVVMSSLTMNCLNIPTSSLEVANVFLWCDNIVSSCVRMFGGMCGFISQS